LEMSVSARLVKPKARVTMVRQFKGTPPPRRQEEYFEATSEVIRRLNEKNLIGWGECLRD
jgi:hypothetical protein